MGDFVHSVLTENCSGVEVQGFHYEWKGVRFALFGSGGTGDYWLLI